CVSGRREIPADRGHLSRTIPFTDARPFDLVRHDWPGAASPSDCGAPALGATGMRARRAAAGFSRDAAESKAAPDRAAVSSDRDVPPREGWREMGQERGR